MKKWTIALSLLVIVGIISFGAVALASQTVHQMNTVAGSDCGDEWLWVVNQLAHGSDAPATITVVTTGGTIQVPLCKVNNHTVHYCVDTLPGDLIDAIAELPNGWSGRFVLSHHPCASPSPSPSPSPAPSPTPNPSPSPAPSPSPGL